MRERQGIRLQREYKGKEVSRRSESRWKLHLGEEKGKLQHDAESQFKDAWQEGEREFMPAGHDFDYEAFVIHKITCC